MEGNGRDGRVAETMGHDHRSGMLGNGRDNEGGRWSHLCGLNGAETWKSRTGIVDASSMSMSSNASINNSMPVATICDSLHDKFVDGDVVTILPRLSTSGLFTAFKRSFLTENWIELGRIDKSKLDQGSNDSFTREKMLSRYVSNKICDKQNLHYTIFQHPRHLN